LSQGNGDKKLNFRTHKIKIKRCLTTLEIDLGAAGISCAGGGGGTPCGSGGG
jgi:hypothetical protein